MVLVAERVRARRLTEEECRRLQQIVRRGGDDHHGVGVREAGTGIARLVQARTRCMG